MIRVKCLFVNFLVEMYLSNIIFIKGMLIFFILMNDGVEIIVLIVMYVILGLLIVIGNIFVIVVFKLNLRFWSINNIFFVGLVIFDLLVGLILILFWIYILMCEFYKICI